MTSTKIAIITLCFGILFNAIRSDCLTSAQLQALGYVAVTNNANNNTSGNSNSYCTNLYNNGGACINASSIASTFSANQVKTQAAVNLAASTLTALDSFTTSLNNLIRNLSGNTTNNATFNSSANTTASALVAGRALKGASRLLQTTDGTVTTPVVTTSTPTDSPIINTSTTGDFPQDVFVIAPGPTDPSITTTTTDPIVIAPAPIDTTTTTDPIVIAPAPTDTSTTTDPVVIAPAPTDTTTTTDPVVIAPVPTDTTTNPVVVAPVVTEPVVIAPAPTDVPTTTNTDPVVIAPAPTDTTTTPVVAAPTTTDGTTIITPGDFSNVVVTSAVDVNNSTAVQAFINSINTNLLTPIASIRSQASNAINNCFQAYESLMNGASCFLTSNAATNQTTTTPNASNNAAFNFNMSVNRDTVGQQLAKCLPLIEAYCVINYGYSINNNFGTLSSFSSTSNGAISLQTCQTLRTNNCNSTACNQAQYDTLINNVFDPRNIRFVSSQATITQQSNYFQQFTNSFNGTLVARTLQTTGTNDSTVTATSSTSGRDIANDGSNSGATTTNYGNGNTNGSWAGVASVFSVLSVILLFIN